MAGRKRVTALKALKLLQSIQEDDSDAEIVIELDTDVYDLYEDNCDDSKGESSSDNESPVSEYQTQKFWILKITKQILKRMKITFIRIIRTTSFATSDGITWDLLNPNQKNFGRRSCHNVITEAPGPSAQAHRSIIKESVRSAWDLFIDESILRHIQRCTEEEARRVLQTDDWCVSLHELDAFLAIIYARGAHKATNIKIHELWNRLWGIPIISETMARNRFIEMMRFLRFNYKQTRSH